MTVDLASGQAAGTAAVTLRAGDGSGATYKARAVTIAPGIASATLTSARTISVALPFASSVPSSWGTTTDSCNAVFTIFQGTSSTMTRTAPIDSCVLEADKKTVTLTLKATNDFAIGDTIDIKDGQTLLSGDASTPVLYIPRPTAVTIAPTIVSAMLVTSTTARVQLPVISNTLGSTTCPQLTFLVLKSSAGSAKGTDSGVGACASVSSGILTYTYVGATFAAGDYLEVVNTDPAMSTPPLNGGGAGGPAYVARGSPVVIYDATTAALFVSATAISSTKIEIMLPTVSALTGSTCPFLAFTPTKTVSSCSLDATGLILTVTLADSTPFVAGSLTVGIAASTTVTLTYGTTAYTSSLTAIQVKPAFASAALTSSSTVVVTLPAGSSLWAHATTDTPNSDGVLGDAACATVLSVNPAGSPTSGPVTLAASACKLVSGESTVLVTYNSAYTPGDTINILASNAGTGSPSGNPMRVGTVVGGEKYIARRAPILITPVIASASAVGLRTIQVVLPTASALFDSTETALTRALTSSECDNVLQVSKADGSKKSLNGTNACALTTTTLLTITLGEDFAPADTVNMKDSNTMLRVGTKSSGPRYGASSAAVKILISFFKSAIAPDTSTVVVKLPFSSKLYTTADAAVTGTPTTVQCDSIVKVGPSTFSSQRALDGTTPCTLDDTTLTLKIDSGTYAAGDYVDVGPGTSTAVSAILRGDTALASVTATSRAYFQAASQTTKTTGALQINPTLTSAAATGRSEIKIMLPVTGFLPSITFNACSKRLAIYAGCKHADGLQKES